MTVKVAEGCCLSEVDWPGLEIGVLGSLFFFFGV